MRQLLISIIASLITVCAYHFYLVHTGRLSPCIKGVYTVNLTQSIDTLRKIAAKQMIQGGVSSERLLQKLQHSLNTLAQNLPDGYLILPDSCVIAGKRKKIDLLTGRIHETKNAQKIVP